MRALLRETTVRGFAIVAWQRDSADMRCVGAMPISGALQTRIYVAVALVATGPLR